MTLKLSQPKLQRSVAEQALAHCAIGSSKANKPTQLVGRTCNRSQARAAIQKAPDRIRKRLGSQARKPAGGSLEGWRRSGPAYCIPAAVLYHPADTSRRTCGSAADAAAVATGPEASCAARSGVPAGISQSNVFFSWSLPLLTNAGNANSLDWHSQYWASRHTESMRALLPDLVDVLLGWAFDENFPDAAKPLVADCFVSFRSAWAQHTQFAQPLVGSLLGDLQKLVAPESARDVPTARRLLALCNCWTAIMRAAGPHLNLDWSGLCSGFLAVLAAAHEGFQPIVRFTPAMVNFAEELCYYGQDSQQAIFDGMQGGLLPTDPAWAVLAVALELAVCTASDVRMAAARTVRRVLSYRLDVIQKCPPAVLGRLLVQGALVSSSDLTGPVAEAWQSVLDLIANSVRHEDISIAAAIQAANSSYHSCPKRDMMTWAAPTSKAWLNWQRLEQAGKGQGAAGPSVGLLLEFLGAVDRGMLAAVQGALHGSASLCPTTAIAFFAANQKACNEWMARMLALQLQAAVAAGAHEATACYFFRRLQMLAAKAAKLKKQLLERSKLDADTNGVTSEDKGASGLKVSGKEASGSDTPEKKLLLRRTDARQGGAAFGALASNVSMDSAGPAPSTFVWLDAFELQAKGQLEGAAKAAKAEVEHLLPAGGGSVRGDSRGLFRLLSSLLCEAYVGVCDWEGLQLWMQEMQVLLAEVQSAAAAAAKSSKAAGQEQEATAKQAALEIHEDCSAAWAAAARWYQQHLVSTSPETWLESTTMAANTAQATSSLDESSQAALQDLALCLCQSLATSGGSSGSASKNLASLLVLLRILRAHSQTVAPIIMQHHERISARVWHAVIPQLFAQLHHHDEAVRQAACTILQQVQAAFPEAVLYPALAQARQDESATQQVLGLVSAARARQPQMLSQLEGIMGEMERITVLPEELWHSILQSLQVDILRRAAVLHSEATRLASIPSAQDRQRIMQERYAAVMLPPILTLQRHLRSLSSPDRGQHESSPGPTPHEARFRNKFLLQLEAAKSSLQAPDFSEAAGSFEEAFVPLRTVARAIADDCRLSKLAMAEVVLQLN
ncbi:hypothetical protein WJX73_007032 [Symbiochloris irregularis]|uniref:Uncharacterized protein n=1 Tax=Symbiochloris irregularis TaxID=706552 RepID=A0AAW1NYR7_9CHLO